MGTRGTMTDHTISRQLRWQYRQKALGRCGKCGLLRDANSAALCPKHVRLAREKYRGATASR